jgi:hypothetical protein
MTDTNVVELGRKRRKSRKTPRPPWSDEEMRATVDAFVMAVYWLRDVFADGQPKRATEVVNAWLAIGPDYGSISAARNALGIQSVHADGGRIWVLNP